MMWTSGSRVRGSCRPATVSGARTRTGISWVMMVSRFPKGWSNATSHSSSLLADVVGKACELEDDVVTMVRASIGKPSFFVSRSCADEALAADFSARVSATSGTSRLMTLLAADWTVYVSKMVS